MEMKNFEKWFVNSQLWNAYHARFHLSKIFEMVEPDPGSIALEIGCGSGFTTSAILSKFPKTKMIGIDYDTDQVQLAKERLTSFDNRISIYQADATNMPFPDRSFDSVFAFYVFHHIQDYGKAIREVQRILKPGGHVYATDISQWFFKLPVIGSLFPAEALFTKEEFLQHLKDSGFKIGKVKGSGPMFYLMAEKVGV